MYVSNICRDHALFWSDVQSGAIYGVLENGTGLLEVVNANVYVPGGFSFSVYVYKMHNLHFYLYQASMEPCISLKYTCTST